MKGNMSERVGGGGGRGDHPEFPRFLLGLEEVETYTLIAVNRSSLMFVFIYI